MNTVSIRPTSQVTRFQTPTAFVTRALGPDDLGVTEIGILRDLSASRVHDIEILATTHALNPNMRPIHSVIGHWRGVSGRTRREYVSTTAPLDHALATLLERRLDYIARKESGLLRYLGHSLKSRLRRAVADLTGTEISKSWQRCALPGGAGETLMLSAPEGSVVYTTGHGTQFVRPGTVPALMGPALLMGQGGTRH